MFGPDREETQGVMSLNHNGRISRFFGQVFNRFSFPCRAYWWFATVPIISMILFVGCTAVVTPPSNPDDPETVYLVDAGYHAGLVLPMGGDRWVRYEFGEWNYFAKNRTWFYQTVPAIAWPTDGALGRRYLTVAGGERELTSRLRGSHVYRLRVEKTDMRTLSRQLDRIFHRRRKTRTVNHVRNLTFVRTKRSYWFVHDCNDEVERWLNELGCQVHGSTMLSNWSLDRPDGDLAP